MNKVQASLIAYHAAI